MERRGQHYSVHPVNYDPDVQCQRCGREHATHLVNSSMTQWRIELYNSELCDHCTEKTVKQLDSRTNKWALME
jgi:hypothetical protein